MSADLPEGFELDAAPPPGFKPDAPSAPASSPDSSFLDDIHASATDFLRGSGEGATFGFGGEARGALDSIGAGFSDTPRATGRGIAAPVMTQQQRANAGAAEGEAEYERDLALSRERSPVMTAAGEVAGAIGSSGVPGGAIAKLAGKAAPGAMGIARGAAPMAANASRLTKLALGTGEAAGVGGLEAAGRDQPVLPAMAVGGAFGAAGGAIGDALNARALRNSAKNTEKLNAKAARYKDMSDHRLLQAAGFERAAITKVQNQPGGVKRLADGIREQGLAADKTLPEARDFLEDAQKLKAKAGAGMQAASNALDNAQGAHVNAGSAANSIEQEIVAGARKAGNEARARLWQRKADELRKADTLSFSDAHARRMEFDGQAGFDMASKPDREAFKTARAIMNDEMERAAKRADFLAKHDGRPAMGEAWRQANKQYSVATEVVKAASKSVGAKAGNLPFGLGDMISGSAGAGIGSAALGPGGVVAGVPAAMAMRAAQKRGNIVASKALGSMSERAATAAGKTGVSATGEKLTGAGGRVGALATRRSEKPTDKPKPRLPDMLRPKLKGKGEGSHIARLVDKALQEDIKQGAAEHYLGAVSNDAYREGSNYNPR